METTMKMSRGLRNNNPGNIVKSAAKWQGEVEGSDSRFCTFNNMTHGYRALLLLLDTYQRKHGCTTLTKIFQRYCPASTQGDDPKRYARNVADFISRHLQTVGQEGWEPDDELPRLLPDGYVPNVGTLTLMMCLLMGITLVENGKRAVEEWRDANDNPIELHLVNAIKLVLYMKYGMEESRVMLKEFLRQSGWASSAEAVKNVQ